jgi:hypothetical protein
MSVGQLPVRLVVRGVLTAVSIASLLTACQSATGPVANTCTGGTTVGSSTCS